MKSWLSLTELNASARQPSELAAWAWPPARVQILSSNQFQGLQILGLRWMSCMKLTGDCFQALTKPKRNVVYLLSTTKVLRVFEIRCDLTWTRLPGCRPSAAVWCCSPAQRWKVEHKSPSSRAWQTDWGSWTEKCYPLPPGRFEQKTEFNWWSDTGALSAGQSVGLSIPWFLCHWDGSSSTCYIPPEQSIGDATPHIRWSTQTLSGSKSKSEFFNIHKKCLFW